MGLFRELLLGFKGPSEFSNIAFRVRSKRFNPSDLDVSCKGKRYLITGANGAIGSVVATEIAKRGGELHMVCRNKESASKVQSAIVKNTGNKDVHLHILDLSKSYKVYSFAEEFKNSCQDLEAIIHVAGTRSKELVRNSDGIEETFAVNTLAPHIFTRILSPLLLQSLRGRILLTSSFSMYLSTLNAHDPELQNVPYSTKKVYTHTKRQLVDLASYYSEEYVDLFSASYSPGWVKSPFINYLDLHPEMQKMFRSPAEGADCLLWLCISDAALSHPNGSYFQDRQYCSKYLPLIWTSITSSRSQHKFISHLDHLMDKLHHNS